MVLLRSMLFNLAFYLNLIVQMIIFSPAYFLMRRKNAWVIPKNWVRSNHWLLKVIVGTSYSVEGLENLPDGPYIIAPKHQSFWDAYALLPHLDDPFYILKRELTWIPLFGWYVVKMRMVPIDRGAKSSVMPAVLERTRKQSIFLAYMVGNALSHQPPLGMFNQLTLLRSGEHKGTVDLKHNGIVPIVDLARVCALGGGDESVNTHDRLLHAASGGILSENSSRDLRDALEFLAATRIRHQARQMAQGQPPDNFLSPTEVSNFERSQLKDAFRVVKTLQEVLGQRFQAGRF